MPPHIISNCARATFLPDLADTVVLRASFKRQTFAPHTHPTYVLALITHGALRFRCGNEVLVAPSGSACLINPGEVQTGEAASEHGCAYWSAYVPPNVFGLAEAQSRFVPHAPLFARHVVRERAIVDALGAFFSDVQAPPGLARTERLLDCLSNVSLHCAGAIWEPGEVDSRLVRRAKDFLSENFDQPIRLENVAHACGVTGFHLTRTFKKHTGLALHAWLVQYRVERARAMMMGGEPVVWTALACGFSDQSHMTRWFRRLLGLTPGDVRAMSRTFKIGPTLL